MIRIGDKVIDQLSYPDGALNIKIPEVDNLLVSWHYQNDSELFTLICLRKHFKNYPMALYMPYCPHARMDRVKSHEDCFTLKYFCEVINSLEFSEVYIEDPHSNVAPALLNNCITVQPYSHLENVLTKIDNEDIVMCYPDEGAMKRYSGLVEKPYCFGIKKRDWETGEIQGLDLMNGEIVKDKDVLIVDDICSRGGTFVHTAKALKDAGAANVYLYVTHCERTIFNGEVFSSGLIEKVFTTNSIFPANSTEEKIEIVE